MFKIINIGSQADVKIARSQAGSIKTLVKLQASLAASKLDVASQAERVKPSKSSLRRVTQQYDADILEKELEQQEEAQDSFSETEFDKLSSFAKNAIIQADELVKEVEEEEESAEHTADELKNTTKSEHDEQIVLANAERHVHEANIDAAKAVVEDAVANVDVLKKQKDLLLAGRGRNAQKTLERAEQMLIDAESSQKTAADVEQQIAEELELLKKEGEEIVERAKKSEKLVKESEESVEAMRDSAVPLQDKVDVLRAESMAASRRLFELSSSTKALSDGQEQAKLMIDLKEAQDHESANLAALSQAKSDIESGERTVESHQADVSQANRDLEDFNQRVEEAEQAVRRQRATQSKQKQVVANAEEAVRNFVLHEISHHRPHSKSNMATRLFFV
jgi:hypothetical protein